jgi:multidrug efflux system membrane fusion protein
VQPATLSWRLRSSALRSRVIGLRLVDPGNIVHASDQNGLAVITQRQPIAIVFTIPEDSLPSVLKQLSAGRRLDVDAYDWEVKTKLASGSLTSVDTQIDPATGTIRLKATFANEHDALFPNQFVNYCWTRSAGPSSFRPRQFNAARSPRSSTS